MTARPAGEGGAREAHLGRCARAPSAQSKFLVAISLEPLGSVIRSPSFASMMSPPGPRVALGAGRNMRRISAFRSGGTMWVNTEQRHLGLLGDVRGLDRAWCDSS